MSDIFKSANVMTFQGINYIRLDQAKELVKPLEDYILKLKEELELEKLKNTKI